MKNSYKLIKNYLSFTLGRNPIVAKTKHDYHNYIPKPFKGVVVLSADFEMAWAWRYAKTHMHNESVRQKLASQERINIPKILSLSDEYNIPITWATVGHLFLESCNKIENIAHPEIPRIPYFQNKWWSYSSGDWFDDDPCSSYQIEQDWYCPDLIRLIKNSNIDHEIACHSFSHIPCNNDICPPSTLEVELQTCINAAKDYNITFESFVFPGHTMGNYKTIKKMGFSSVRTNYKNILGYPELIENGLWLHPATMEITYNKSWPDRYNEFRYRKLVEMAIQKHLVCNLWFHPSLPEAAIDNTFKGLFKFLDSVRGKVLVTTMNNYTKWLNSNNKAT